jgi:hypothetical protein
MVQRPVGLDFMTRLKKLQPVRSVFRLNSVQRFEQGRLTMDYEFYWVLFGLALVFGWAGLAIWARYLRNKQRARYREMIHKERMAAIEKGIPMGEIPEAGEMDTIVDEKQEGTSHTQAVRWVRLGSLGFGLLLFFFGIGFFIAFNIIPDTPSTRGMQEVASLGFIPALSGLGLLAFFLLTRRADT